MGIGSSILVLVFHLIFRWVNKEAIKVGFKPMGKTLYYATMIAMVFYCIAVEPIDGKSNGPLHTPSAVIFFLTFEMVIVDLTLYLYRLREWNTNVISARSMWFKIFLAVYITIVWVYCLSRSLSSEDENKTDFTVVVEWNAYLIDIMWVLSYAEEWKQIKLCLVPS